MRKLLISSALALFVVGAVSAIDIELGVNYFAVPYQSFSGEDDTKMTLPEPAGVEVNASFFFGSPCSFIDLGLNVRGGVGFANSFTIKEDGEKEKYDVEDSWDAFFKIGPTIRFNLGEMHSIVVAPGFQFDFVVGDCDFNNNGEYHPIYELYCPKFDLEIGYRCWFIHSPNYNFGLNVGTDLQWYPWVSPMIMLIMVMVIILTLIMKWTTQQVTLISHGKSMLEYALTGEREASIDTR